jgi:hypothetical protein
MDITKLEGIDLTEKQLERQLNKIRGLIFEDYELFDDGSYKGEIKENIAQILQDNIPDTDELNDILFLKMVKDATVKITEYILKNIKGVDKRLVALYTYDFVNQTYNSIYSINLKFKDNSENDSMYI